MASMRRAKGESPSAISASRARRRATSGVTRVLSHAISRHANLAMLPPKCLNSIAGSKDSASGRSSGSVQSYRLPLWRGRAGEVGRDAGGEAVPPRVTRRAVAAGVAVAQPAGHESGSLTVHAAVGEGAVAVVSSRVTRRARPDCPDAVSPEVVGEGTAVVGDGACVSSRVTRGTRDAGDVAVDGGDAGCLTPAEDAGVFALEGEGAEVGGCPAR